jgi:hypothetical protein
MLAGYIKGDFDHSSWQTSFMTKNPPREKLADCDPELVAQWHPTKNGQLTPFDVTAGSGRKVWWKCPKGDDHEWPAIVANRVKGIGCPICSNQRVTRSNSLGTVRSDLASQWHPEKNGDLTPFDVLPSSNRKIWWLGDCGHEWDAKLNNRYNGKGCPICANQKIVRENSLGTVNPGLAEQWHPTKNLPLTPFDVAPAGNDRVWWKCPKGDDHEWEATVNHRAKGTGCPLCNPVWSIPELRLYCELKTIFPGVQHRAKVNGQEVDIYIPEIRTGIEYDGVHWHRNNLEKDQAKNQKLESSLLLVRVREQGLPMIGTHDISCEKLSVDTVKHVLRVIQSQTDFPPEFADRLGEYLTKKRWVASELFNKLYAERKTVCFEASLTHLFPNLAKEWHPTKNPNLLPDQFSPGAARKVWWVAECGHEWQDTINHRSGGRGCPECRYKKARATRKQNQNRNQLGLFKE